MSKRFFSLLALLALVVSALGCRAETAKGEPPVFRELDRAPAPGTTATVVEGVEFSAEQVVAVVWGVNHASLTELENDVGLSNQASDNLVASAPYASMEEIAYVAYVGPAMLGHLRDHAEVWGAELDGQAPSLAGSYDGVSFDEATAGVALEIANTASYEDLTNDGGIYGGGAEAIVGARPFDSLARVSDTYGVGPATMQSLHDYAASGTFVAGTP
jgi:DNA uptake protein ComE-like DNA-binding protein